MRTLFILTLVAVLGLTTACTPEQLASIQSTLGVDLTSDQEAAFLQLPDMDAHLNGYVFHPDGTVSRPTAPPGSRCPQFYDEAIAAGWPAWAWYRLDSIMYRESGCNPAAHRRSTTDDSYGLLQLNMRALRSWVGPMVGYDYTRLFDPATNLRVGRKLYLIAQDWWGCGWRPWSLGC